MVMNTLVEASYNSIVTMIKMIFVSYTSVTMAVDYLVEEDIVYFHLEVLIHWLFLRLNVVMQEDTPVPCLALWSRKLCLCTLL